MNDLSRSSNISAATRGFAEDSGVLDKEQTKQLLDHVGENLS